MRMIRPHYIAAVSLSLAAHAAVALLVGPGGKGGGADAVPTGAMRERPIAVRLQAGAGSRLVLPAPEQRTGADRRDRQDPPQPPGAVGAAAESSFPFQIAAAPHYFSSKDLTERPRVLRDIPENLTLTLPDVPPQTAIVRLLINERGAIDRVVMEDSTLPEHAARLVAEAFSETRFHPGRIDDVPVKSQLRIEIALENADQPAAAPGVSSP
ncbi:MAG TPA: hypothetical protein VEC06_18255 [Paucimonas sp.]|nr:hypothetical protein [Paucimonas sp.]